MPVTPGEKGRDSQMGCAGLALLMAPVFRRARRVGCFWSAEVLTARPSGRGKDGHFLRLASMSWMMGVRISSIA